MEYIDKFVMPPPLNILSFVFWITAVSYRKLRRHLHNKAGEKEPTWKKKHRYSNIFGLYPPKIHLLTAEEKKHSEMSKSRDSSTENTLPSLFQYVDAIKPFFARDLSTGINGSLGYTVEDIDDFEEMVTKNALEQVETVSMILKMGSKLLLTKDGALKLMASQLTERLLVGQYKSNSLISKL